MDNEEKVATADDFFLEMEEQAYKGKKIVKVIVISSYVSLVLEFICYIILGKVSLLAVIIWFLLCIVYYKLYAGRVWAKWLYIILCAIGTIYSVVVFVQLADAGLLNLAAEYTAIAVGLWISLAVFMVRIAFGVLLIVSKSVHEFLYRQMAGG